MKHTELIEWPSVINKYESSDRHIHTFRGCKYAGEREHLRLFRSQIVSISSVRLRLRDLFARGECKWWWSREVEDGEAMERYTKSAEQTAGYAGRVKKSKKQIFKWYLWTTRSSSHCPFRFLWRILVIFNKILTFLFIHPPRLESFLSVSSLNSMFFFFDFPLCKFTSSYICVLFRPPRRVLGCGR